MRGSPPTHLFLLLLAFALVALPLAQLTLGREQGANAEERQPSSEAEGSDQPAALATRIVVRVAHPPRSLALQSGDRNLLDGLDWKTTPMEIETELPAGPDGLELLLDAEWDLEASRQTAITVEVEPEGQERRSETRWSDGGTLSEVLTFEWK